MEQEQEGRPFRRPSLPFCHRHPEALPRLAMAGPRLLLPPFSLPQMLTALALPCSWTDGHVPWLWGGRDSTGPIHVCLQRKSSAYSGHKASCKQAGWVWAVGIWVLKSGETLRGRARGGPGCSCSGAW